MRFGPNALFKDLAEGDSSCGIAVLRYDKRTFLYKEPFASGISMLAPPGRPMRELILAQLRYLLPQAGAEPKPEEASEPPEAGTRQEPTQERTPRLDEAGLLRRSFALDVFACVRCGCRRRVLASLTAPGGVSALLEPLGLPPRPGRLAPARGPPQNAWF